MDNEEFIRVEEEIRSIIAEADLQWILTSVDEAISAGISSEKGIIVQQRRRRTSMGSEEFEFARLVEPGGREHPKRVVSTNEPFSPQQRVELFISALGRAITELPSIQEETLKHLAETPNQDSVPVHSLRFMPEEDAVASAGPPEMENLQNAAARQRRIATQRVLDALEAEVNS